jgi:hypothetical protein
MATITSSDENAVGETISGSSGNPQPCTNLNSEGLMLSSATDLEYVRVAYQGWGVSCSDTITVRHCQFLHCSVAGVYSMGGGSLQNDLFTDCTRAWYDMTGSSALDVENVTADNCPTFLQGFSWSTNESLCLTNCLITGVTNLCRPIYGTTLPRIYTNCSVITSNRAGFYQTVGAASYYLCSGSSNRSAGATNVNPQLRADLKLKTTYPPIVYSNTSISVPTTFNPQAQRETASIDIGYAYDPLDWAFGGVNFYTNVTFNPGTSVGWFELPGSGGPGYGIGLYDYVTATFSGIATEPCIFARYDTVQEGGNGNWRTKGWLAGIAAQTVIGPYPANAATVAANFTHFALLANDPNNCRDYNNLITVRANNCEFYSGNLTGYGMTLALTNSLFLRVAVGDGCDCSPSVSWRNCTFIGGSAYLNHWSSTTWPVWIENCAFDNTDFTNMNDYSAGDTNITYCDYNAFLTNASRTVVEGTHDLTVTNFNWEAGPLGDFYLSTNSPLINAGSVTADTIGLYHFTVMTNLISGLEIKETNSVADLGYHAVAVDTNGLPINTSGNGADYLLDSNGNGVVDSGEIGWNLPGDLGLQVIITRPRSNSVIP